MCHCRPPYSVTGQCRSYATVGPTPGIAAKLQSLPGFVCFIPLLGRLMIPRQLGSRCEHLAHARISHQFRRSIGGTSHASIFGCSAAPRLSNRPVKNTRHRPASPRCRRGMPRASAEADSDVTQNKATGHGFDRTRIAGRTRRPPVARVPGLPRLPRRLVVRRNLGDIPNAPDVNRGPESRMAAPIASAVPVGSARTGRVGDKDVVPSPAPPRSAEHWG